jgi:hypothetical protein
VRTMKLSDIVLDFTLYPRGKVDGQHVASMVEALRAGAVLPPPVIDRKSKRCVDGFHRHAAHKRFDGPSGKIEVVEKSYKNDSELYLDAARYNRDHGKALSPWDKRVCIVRAQELGIAPEAIADALAITVAKVNDICTERPALSGEAPVPIKNSIRHMAGQPMTKHQIDVNRKLSGMSPAFHARQLIMLIESDLLDKTNKDLVEVLRKLSGMLEELLAVK